MALTIPVAEIVKQTKNPLLGKHKSWERVLLGEIATVLNGYAFKSAKFASDKGFPLIRIRDIGKDATDTYYDGEYDKKYIVEKGDLLIGMDGDFHSARWRGPKGLLNQRVCKVVLEAEDFLISFLEYLLPGYLKAINNVTSSVTVKHLSSQSIKEIPLPFPPVNEQKRIVAEIEKQFSRLDEAVGNLKRVKVNLKRHKASVLKAAVEGGLTEEWRKANPDVEPAGKLLERVLAKRRKKWEGTELAKMKAKGKVPKDDKWKKKYKEPDVADKINMELPKGWIIATVKQLSNRVQYGSSSKTSESSGDIPVLRMGNIFEGKLLFDKLKYLPESHDEFPELLLESDDLLFNRTNSPELVGKTAVYKGKPSPCSFASYLIRARFINGVDPNFICYFINSNYGRQWIKSVVSQQVGQANVNGTKLQALSVPLPPHNEQGIIVSEVENKFSIIDGIEKEVDRNLIRADRLRQSVLKKAFSGKLIQSREL